MNTFKSQPTLEAEQRIKNKSKKETKEMKTPTKTTRAVVASVLVTLLVVASFAAVFYLGTQYQQNQNDMIVQAKAEATAVATQLKTPAK